MENVEILKEVLSAETYAAVENETKDSTIKLADLSKGGYVDVGKYNTLNTQYNDTKALLDTKTAEYDELLKTAGDNAELKTQIETLKTNYEQEKTAINEKAQKEILKYAAASHIINKYHPNDVNDIMPLIDLTKASIINEKVVGIDEQIEPLTTNKPYLWKKEDTKPNSGLPHKNDYNGDLAAIRASFGLKD